MNSTRVAYILASYPAPSETFIRREIDAVRRQGVAIDVYSLRKPTEPEAGVCYRGDIPAGEKFGAAAWAICRPARLASAVRRILAEQFAHPLALAKSLRNVLTAAAFARRIQRSGAIALHAHFASEPAAVARTISLLTSLPYTFSVHARDIFLLEKPSLVGRIRCARAVSACTFTAFDRVKELVPADMHDRVHRIPHGIDVGSIGCSAAVHREPMVMMAGRLVEKKGTPVLLKALALLRDAGRPVPCTILGDGPERPAIERLIGELGIGNLVRLHGWASPGTVRGWMTQASVLAVPSIIARDGDRDGLPNVILEAAAAGLPVVASDVGGIRDFIMMDGFCGLLVPPGDPQALADAITRLLDDSGLRQKLVEQAQVTLKTEYDAEVNAVRLIDAMGWSCQAVAP